MYSVVWAKKHCCRTFYVHLIISKNKVKISEFPVCFVSAYFLRIEAIWLLFTGNIPRGIAGNGADRDMRRYIFGKKSNYSLTQKNKTRIVYFRFGV